MSKSKQVLCVLLILFMALPLFACSGDANPSLGGDNGDENLEIVYTVSETGNIIVDGVDSGVTIHGYNIQEDKGKEVYDIFKKYNPDYTYPKTEWEKQLKDQSLVTTYKWDVLQDDIEVNNGQMSVSGDTYTLSSMAGVLMHAPILSLADKAMFSISIEGRLAAGGESKILLSTQPDNGHGRVHIGADSTQNFLYIGVNVYGKTYEYGWKVPAETLKSKHSYFINYCNRDMELSIDDNAARKLDLFGYDRSGYQIIADPNAASSELRTKIIATQYQPYVNLAYIGSTHTPANAEINILSITTSALFGRNPELGNPLKDKLIYYLGSSITEGAFADGVGFGEIIAHITEGKYVKEAVSGTTLGIKDGNTNSYVERLSKLDFSKSPDYLVVQISTNDTWQGIELGDVSTAHNKDSFNKKTVLGAVEYIIAHVRDTSPNTKVIFYSCPVKKSWGNRVVYDKIVNSIKEKIVPKWGIQVNDLLNLEYVRRDLTYFGDDIHPNRNGYISLFVPTFIEMYLQNIG